MSRVLALLKHKYSQPQYALKKRSPFSLYKQNQTEPRTHNRVTYPPELRTEHKIKQMLKIFHYDDCIHTLRVGDFRIEIYCVTSSILR